MIPLSSLIALFFFPSSSSSSFTPLLLFLLVFLPQIFLAFLPAFFLQLYFFLHNLLQICMAAFLFCFLHVTLRVCVCAWESSCTHTSVRLCCSTAIHHHFICLNWMPSGPLILPISPLTNSCSAHTQKNNTQTHTLSQTRFSPPVPVSASFFPLSLVKEWEEGDGVAERFIRRKVMV